MDGYTITAMERKTRHGIRFSTSAPSNDVEGWQATVIVPQGGTMFLSRMDGDERWVADAYFGANGFPHWCHSFGERTTTAQVAQGELAAALDEAVLLREKV